MRDDDETKRRFIAIFDDLAIATGGTPIVRTRAEDAADAAVAEGRTADQAVARAQARRDARQQSLRVYFRALSVYPIETVQAAALQLAKTAQRFPLVNEWTQAVRRERERERQAQRQEGRPPTAEEAARIERARDGLYHASVASSAVQGQQEPQRARFTFDLRGKPIQVWVPSCSLCEDTGWITPPPGTREKRIARRCPCVAARHETEVSA